MVFWAICLSGSKTLSERRQCERVGNTLSSMKPLTSGVVQGSCLGPLLFVICINDIVSCGFHCLTGVINKPTMVELCISPVYRRLAVAQSSKSTM